MKPTKKIPVKKTAPVKKKAPAKRPSKGVSFTDFPTLGDIIATLEARAIELHEVKKKLKLTEAAHLASVKRENELTTSLDSFRGRVATLEREALDLKASKVLFQARVTELEKIRKVKHRVPGVRQRLETLLDGDFHRYFRNVEAGGNSLPDLLLILRELQDIRDGLGSED